MLNSAHCVMFPIRSPLPSNVPSGASVNFPPIAPPMILNPRMWTATSGNVANSSAIFVSAPVATTHAVPGFCARSEFRIARIAFVCVIGGERASGSKSVPSRPDSPTLKYQHLLHLLFFDIFLRLWCSLYPPLNQGIFLIPCILGAC